MRLRSGAGEHRALPFPDAAAMSLRDLSALPNPSPLALEAGDALRSFRDAPSQRAQASALRVLSGLLRRGDRAPRDVCRVAGPALAALVLDSPTAPHSVASAALRAALRARCDESTVAGGLRGLLRRLEEEKGGRGRSAADVRAVLSITAEVGIRFVVCGSVLRLRGAATLAKEVAWEAVRDGGSGMGLTSALNVLQEVCRSLCDVVRGREGKATQEDVSWFDDGQVEKLNRGNVGLVAVVLDTVPDLCLKAMGLPNGQRRDIMSAAVLLVAVEATKVWISADIPPSPEALVSTVRDCVLDPSRNTSAFTQLFLLRAVVESPDFEPARKQLLMGSGAADADSGMQSFIEQFCALCSGNADLALRFLSMESAVLSLRHLQPGTLPPAMRKRVLELVEERWEESYSGISAQMRDALDALVRLDDPTNQLVEREFWLEYAISLLDRFSASIGMYPPLSRVVRRVEARRVLALRPDTINSVLGAVAVDNSAAKPVADFLESLWGNLFDELQSVEDFCELTAASVVFGLVNKQSQSVCERVSLYIIPAYLRSSKGEETALVRALLVAVEATDCEQDDAMRATIVILSTAKRFGSAVSSDMITGFLDKQVSTALSYRDPDVRLSALEVITAGSLLTEPLSVEEISLVLSGIPTLIYPGSSRSEKHRTQRCLAKFVERLHGSSHAAETSGGWWVRERKARHGGKRTDAFEMHRRAYIQKARHSLSRFCHILLGHCHPCAAPDRRRSSLELLLEFCSCAGYSFMLEAETPSSMIMRCLNASVADPWEPSRQAALGLASLISSSVSNDKRREMCVGYFRCALPLVRSPRVSEAESGAALCRLIYRLTVTSAGQVPDGPCVLYPKDNSFEKSGYICPSSVRGGPVEYVDSVVEAALFRIAAAKEDLALLCESGLVFGDLRVLRQCILDVNWSEVCVVGLDEFARVRNLGRKILDCLQVCVDVALGGIDIQANGFVDESLPVPDEILTSDSAQKVATSCYLTVKEICVTLGVLVESMGTIRGNGGKASASLPDLGCGQSTFEIFAKDDVERIGEMFNVVFRVVRHNGVINGAFEGYEGVCAYLLRSRKRDFNRLPQLWANQALDVVLGGDAYTLRRSAGMPYFALGAVRAEANVVHGRGARSFILCEVMKRLMGKLETSGFGDSVRIILHGELGEASLVSASLEFDANSERPVVHALNVLRLVFLDAALAIPVTRFLAQCVMYALAGFLSSSWLVRNSCFMLLSALIRRGIGAPSEKCHVELEGVAIARAQEVSGDIRRVSGVTAPQFFSKYPELHSYLLNILTCSFISRDNKSVVATTGIVDELALYPSLYLLSSLSPSIDVDELGDHSVRHFRNVVEDCLSARADCVRRIAALCLVQTVCTPANVVSYIDRVLTNAIKLRVHDVRQNRLHGELLGAAALLKIWCRGPLLSTGEKETLLCVLSRCTRDHLACCDHMRQNSCSVTRASFLRVLRRCVKFARLACSANVGASTHERRLHAALDVFKAGEYVAVSCLLDSLSSETCGKASQATVLRGAAKLFVMSVSARSMAEKCNLGPDPYGVLVLHAASDVREVGCASLATLTWSSESALALWSNVQKALFQSKCSSNVESLCTLACKLLEALRGESSAHLSEMARTLSCSSAIVRQSQRCGCQEASLVLTGHCIRFLSMARTAEIQTLTEEWISLLEEFHVLQDQSSTSAAVLQAIEASDWLCVKIPDKSHVRARSLIILVNLLQDESQLVREWAMRVARQLSFGTCQSHVRDILPSLKLVYESMQHLCFESGILRHFEKVLGMASDGAFGAPLHAVFNVSREESRISPYGVAGLERSAASSKLFRDDGDSLNSEPDILAQFAARTLVSLAIEKEEVIGDACDATNMVRTLLATWVEELCSILKGRKTCIEVLATTDRESYSQFQQTHLLLCRIAALRGFFAGALPQMGDRLRYSSRLATENHVHPCLWHFSLSTADFLDSPRSSWSAAKLQDMFFLIL